jgi:3',5'-cyclic AMP phosphodiesterase CpdA
MQQVAESRPFDALILLGDNVYPDGSPTRLQTTVFEPFAPLLGDGTRVFAVLGNHDVQQDHADGHAAALGMPGRWYAEHLGPMLFVGLDSTEPRDPDQLKWLEDTLAAATEPWRIVALHHPPYSAGQHGSDKDVRDAFAPLFARYGVQLVLAGHDHDYQRSEPIDGVTYIVSGGAATLRPTGRAGFTAVSWSTYHFLDIAVWADHLIVRAIGHDQLVHDVVELRLNQQRNSSERPGDGGTEEA